MTPISTHMQFLANTEMAFFVLHLATTHKLKAKLLLSYLLNRITYFDKVKLRFEFEFFFFVLNEWYLMWPFEVVTEHPNGQHWLKSTSFGTK